MRSIITISGDLGSGKSTVAKILAKELGVPCLSTGAFQREIAGRRGVTSLELNRLAEKDTSIDFEIDALTAQIEAQGRAVVVDSRMAWHFIPSSLRVYLIADEVVSADRILHAERNSELKYQRLADALDANRERRKSELGRFKTLYGVDLQDWNNFDIVINTSIIEPDTVSTLIQEQARASENIRHGVKYYTSPKACFPTGRTALGAMVPDSHPMIEEDQKCELINVRGADLIWRGEPGIRNAILAEKQLMEASVVATKEEDLLPSGLAVSELLASLPTRTVLHDWENALGFRFYRYPQWYPEK